MSTQVSVDMRPITRAMSNLESTMQMGFSNVNASVDLVRESVDIVHDEVSSTYLELQELRQRFEEYVEQAERAVNIQRAETKLSGLKADLDREFGHHNVVRRTSIGVLQAFDIGNVTNRTVGRISEELMIQTPRYWLAPALVALAAWSRDDEEMAKRSLDEAFKRDTRKTALFFSLVLRRQGRLNGSVRWLRQYMTGVDPMVLSREFVIVLECVNLGAFGIQGQELASEKIAEWNAQLSEDPAVVEKQTETWRDFMGTHRQELGYQEFPLLKKTCKQWGTIKDLLESASAIPVAADWFEDVKNRQDSRSQIAADVLDEILESLVTEFDSDELPLRREILYNESVIEENGALDRAQERASALQHTLDETLDLLSLETASAMEPDALGVGAGTQRAAIASGRNEALSGISRYTTAYRANVINEGTIELSGNHSKYAPMFNFPSWIVSTATPDSQAVESLRSTWDSAISAQREELTFKPTTLMIPGIIALVVAVIAFIINPIAGLVALVGGGGIVGWMYYSKQTASQKALAQLEATKDAAVEESVQIYRAAIAEFTDAGQLYVQLDGQESDLLEILNTWPTAQM